MHAAVVACRRAVDPPAQHDLCDHRGAARRLRRCRGGRRPLRRGGRDAHVRRADDAGKAARRRPAPPRALRAALVGGGPIAPALLERASAAGVATVTTYGLTEACSQVTTGGPALFCTRVRVGPHGEILVAGPTLAPGALADDGWLHTGDLGALDEAGNLTVTGRAADTIVTGGENVSPVEVEAVLASHPAVADVAVHGVADRAVGRADRRNGCPAARDDRNLPGPEGLLCRPAGSIQGAQSGQVLPRLAEDAVGKAPAPRSGGMNATNGPSSLAIHRCCTRRRALCTGRGAGGHLHRLGRSRRRHLRGARGSRLR